MTTDIDIHDIARAALADVAIAMDRREDEERSLVRAMQAYVEKRGADPAALRSMGRVTARTVAMLYAAAVEAS